MTINRRPPIRKRWGQHFLSDPNTINRIVAAIDPQTTDDLLEIGPGHGEITIPLASTVRHITAVDIDPMLVAGLEGMVGANVTLVQEDILKSDLAALLTEGIRVYGSLPYNISSQIIFSLLKHRLKWRDGHFIMQREVADRLAASHGSKTYGRLSVMVQAYATVEKVLELPPTVFIPRPKVSSTLVRLTPKGARTGIQDDRRFEVLVRAAFGQRRKMLSNALKGLDTGSHLAAMEISGLRAEQVPVDQFINLANQLSAQ